MFSNRSPLPLLFSPALLSAALTLAGCGHIDYLENLLAD